MKSDELSGQTTSTEASSASSRDMDLLDLLIILSGRRRLIFGVTFGAAILTAVIVSLIPNKYMASTVLLPPNQNSSTGSALLGQIAGSSVLASAAGASLGIKNPGEMYVALFRSQTVEDSLIHRFGLMTRYRVKRMSDARKAFENSSTVVLGAKDGLIRVSVTDRDPKMATDIANGYVDEYRKLTENLAITEASQRRLFFQHQLLEASNNLASAEEAMEQTERTTGVVQVEGQVRSLIESAATLRGEVAAKQVQLQGMRTYATEDNPEIVTAEQQLDALKSQLAELGGTEKNPSSDLIVPKGNLSQASMEYVRKLRDVKYYETVEELIARQFEMAKLDEARQGAQTQVVDVATPPDRKSSPKRIILTFLAALAALVTSVLYALLSAGVYRLSQDAQQKKKLESLRQSFMPRK